MRPTPSFSKPPPDERVLYLPKGETVHGVADRCREAGLAFVRGTTGAWGPRDLAGWLVTHYEAATAPTRTLVASRRTPPSGPRGVDAARLERVVLDARARLFEMLDRCPAAWEGDAFAQTMVDGMLVVGVHDASGAIGYAPVRYGQMRLVDRVASLFVADYLTRPNDYQTLVTCEECGDVAFDGISNHAAWCAEPPIRSDMVPAIEVPSRDTLPGIDIQMR
jgi:hypothetical protein